MTLRKIALTFVAMLALAAQPVFAQPAPGAGAAGGGAGVGAGAGAGIGAGVGAITATTALAIGGTLLVVGVAASNNTSGTTGSVK